MKLLYLSLCLLALLPMTTNAQDIQVRLNHLALQVKNLETSREFYKDVVGLPQISDPFNDDIHAWLDMGGSQLHLIEGGKDEGEKDKNNHLCFSVDDMDAFIEKLRKHNITFSDWPGKEGAITTRPDGIQQIYFQDPDGHWIEVNDDHFG
ncbi:VOC family protein [Litoribacter populi]|uniref:VOC family protein n=1 Tax=Litoribacter populi TaxID=2598460 RepID=UPI00117E3C75|nr:VOC family protein [Litoribacter populi]